MYSQIKVHFYETRLSKSHTVVKTNQSIQISCSYLDMFVFCTTYNYIWREKQPLMSTLRVLNVMFVNSLPVFMYWV